MDVQILAEYYENYAFFIYIIIFGPALLCLRQVNPGQFGFIFRNKQFERLVKPGWRFVIPVVEKLVKVSTKDPQWKTKLQQKHGQDINLMSQLAMMEQVQKPQRKG